jgi:hypothetical protein
MCVFGMNDHLFTPFGHLCVVENLDANVLNYFPVIHYLCRATVVWASKKAIKLIKTMLRTSSWFIMEELVQTLGKQSQSTSFQFTRYHWMGQACTEIKNKKTMEERKVKTVRRKNIQYDEQLIISSQIYFFF